MISSQIMSYEVTFQRHAQYRKTWEHPCADPGIFVGGGGGPVQSDKKSSDNVFFFFFFFFFLVLSLFYRGQVVDFKEIYHFSRFQRGPSFFKGGPTFSRGGGGSNCLFPIETHITCDFPGVGGPDPLSPHPPLDPHLSSDFKYFYKFVLCIHNRPYWPC